MDLESLLARLPQDLSPADRDLIERAYHYAAKAHAGQVRRSGQAYITHCEAVAQIVADMKLDAVAVVAALLHDTVEDTPLALVDLEEEFGPEVAALVDGVTKLDSIPRVKDGKLVNTVKRMPGSESEFLRKTFLAMDQDVRIVLIKLADRLHNMRTLRFLSPRRQRAIAQETMEIFAPLADRMGIWKMKRELEDLSFRYLQPERYKEIANALDDYQESGEARLHEIVRCVERKLSQANIPAEVSVGPRYVYDIYRQMRRKDVSLEHLHDLRPVRVIVGDTLSCYQVLGILHSIWRPMDSTFDDYIAVPKDNFYQSLHTTVLTEGGRSLTLQIRTPGMHEHAQYGVAAHWRHPNGRDSDEAFERRIRYLRGLLDVGRDLEDADEFIDALRSDVFQDRVYVLTPRGDVIDLPVGATPIDFAYRIHTEIGHRCRGAKANGKLVGLDYTLKTGDKVEIITAKRGGPSVTWLNSNLGYVKTKRALTKVRQWFRRQDRENAVAVGEEVVARELRRLGVSWLGHEAVARLFAKETNDFLAAVGTGDIDAHQVATRILEAERDQQTCRQAPAGQTSTGLNIAGAEGMLITLAACCKPKEGQAIVGYLMGERKAMIHRADCPEISGAHEDQLIDVSWRRPGEERYPVLVVITAYDREGLMRDIGAVIAAERVNMTDVSISTANNIATCLVTMEVTEAAQLSRVLARIEQLTNVVEAHRCTAGQA
jgi:guanosine-3',5'-bis(diphosphate) 3'-pyrophosphohydrolase